MEKAPLVAGHDHARRAVVETQKGSGQSAREEHELAAGEFASAQSGTEDLEVGSFGISPIHLFTYSPIDLFTY